MHVIWDFPKPRVEPLGGAGLGAAAPVSRLVQLTLWEMEARVLPSVADTLNLTRAPELKVACTLLMSPAGKLTVGGWPAAAGTLISISTQ